MTIETGNPFSKVIMIVKQSHRFFQRPHQLYHAMRSSGSSCTPLLRKKQIIMFKQFWNTHFHIKDFGFLKNYFGIKGAHSSRDIFLSQCKYVLDILSKIGLLGTKSCDFPMGQKLRLIDDGAILEEPSFYRQLVSCLIYLTIKMLKIAYSIHILS